MELREDYQRYGASVQFQRFLLMQRFYFIEGVKRTARVAVDSGEVIRVLEELMPDRRQRAVILRILRSDNPRPQP